MSAADTSWSVVSTVSEAPQAVLAFVAHALRLGAAEVELFLDQPDDDLARLLAGHGRVRLTRCDPAYWRGVPGGRPYPAAMRQRINLQAALDAARHPWVLHIDADEFLWGPPDLGARLSGLPDSVDYAIVHVAERVHSSRAPASDRAYDGRFRHMLHDAALQARLDAIDGDAAPMLSRGMAGYAGGKSFFRTGAGLRAGIHVPEDCDPSRGAALTDHVLLHFDGLTPRAWGLKKRRKIAQQPEWRSFPDSHRATRNQLAAVHAAGDDMRRVAEVYRRLKTLDPAREAALEEMGLIFDADLRLEAAVEDIFPAENLDLSVEAIDAVSPAYAARRDLQAVKHELRALASRFTGRQPRP